LCKKLIALQAWQSFAMDFTFCRRKPCSSDGKIAIRNKSCSASMIVSNELDNYRKITEPQRNTIRSMLEGQAGSCFFLFSRQ
jgi:hypothetical protein